MKKILLAGLIALFSSKVQSQHINFRMNFPTGVSIGPSAPSPFRGGVWIGPEWQWQGGKYVHIPGYWAKPHRRKTIWIQGHWKQTRRGYIWVAGRWR